MSHKTSPARRAAFFDALRATGNQTLACERAKVSRSWVQLQRSTDPRFRADVSAAVAEAKASSLATLRIKSGATSGAEAARRLGPSRRRGAGREGHGRLGRRQAHPDRAGAVEAVDAAGGAAVPDRADGDVQRDGGLRGGGDDAVRRLCAPQALAAVRGDLWDEAIAEGFARIEIALLENALNLFSARPELPPDTPLRGMDVAQAIRLLHMHKHGVLGLGGKPGRWRRPKGIEHHRESIRRKVAAIIAARDIPPEARAADARAYKRRRGADAPREAELDRSSPLTPALSPPGRGG